MSCKPRQVACDSGLSLAHPRASGRPFNSRTTAFLSAPPLHQIPNHCLAIHRSPIPQPSCPSYSDCGLHYILIPPSSFDTRPITFRLHSPSHYNLLIPPTPPSDPPPPSLTFTPHHLLTSQLSHPHLLTCPPQLSPPSHLSSSIAFSLRPLSPPPPLTLTF